MIKGFNFIQNSGKRSLKWSKVEKTRRSDLMLRNMRMPWTMLRKKKTFMMWISAKKATK